MFESWVCRHDPFEYEYRCTEYEYRFTEYEYRFTEYEYRCTEYEYRCTEYEYRCTEYEYRCTQYECDLADELVSTRISLMPVDRTRSASPTRIGFEFQMDIRLS